MSKIYLPAKKFFPIVPGVIFRYRFMYAVGSRVAPAGIDLTNYSGQLALTSVDGVTPYATYDTTATPGTSGVFFGGDNSDPTNGLIDLVIIASNTASILWTSALYTLALQNPLGEVDLVLIGAFNVASLVIQPLPDSGVLSNHSGIMASNPLGVLDL